MREPLRHARRSCSGHDGEMKTMNPFRPLSEPMTDVQPRVFYILPKEQDQEAPIGPGDLEIEFEFEEDWDAEDE